MLLRPQRRRHFETAFIAVATRLCQACGQCVEACPQGVLTMISLPGHRHVHVSRAEQCKGCLRCVRACQAGAIQAKPHAGG